MTASPGARTGSYLPDRWEREGAGPSQFSHAYFLPQQANIGAVSMWVWKLLTIAKRVQQKILLTNNGSAQNISPEHDDKGKHGRTHEKTGTKDYPG